MTKLRMPPNCINATPQHVGEVITLVGAEVFRKAMAARPTVKGFKEVKRDGTAAISHRDGNMRTSRAADRRRSS